VLLLAFAALMLIAAAAMLRRSTRTDFVMDAAPPADPSPTDTLAVGGEGTTAAAVLAPTVSLARTTRVTRAVAVKVTAAGLVVGFLTGFLGVGGGFVIVPALVMALDFPITVAVGTSLLVIALNPAAALAARAGSETFHWAVIVPFTIAAIAGSMAGKKLADRASGDILGRWFAVSS